MPVAYVYGVMVDGLTDLSQGVLADFIRRTAAPELGHCAEDMEVSFLATPVFSLGAMPLNVIVLWSTPWPRSQDDWDQIARRRDSCLRALRVLFKAPELLEYMGEATGRVLVEAWPRPGCNFQLFPL